MGINSDRPPQAKTALRKVRSFVRRTGRMSDSQKQALEQLWPQWGLDVSDKPYQWQQVFGRAATLTIDIGFGMGHSLLTLAEKYPEQDFIGIEVHLSGVANVLKGIAEKQLDNVRLFNADAIDVLQQCIPDQSIDKFLLLFPDPWHKKRHHKRRLVKSSFVELLAAKLKPQGLFHVATDWQDYAQHVLDVMNNCPQFEALMSADAYHQRPAYRPQTKYEQRGVKFGHEIWDLAFKRR